MVHFRPKGKNEKCPDIKINGSQINQVDKAKFLGVIIDCKLTWADHTKHVIQKISKGIGIIIKARKYFNQETLLNLYNTLILPFMSYCIHVWGRAADIYLDKIHILQKKIVRIISGVPPRTHSQPLFDELNIMKIKQLYKYFICVFMYKLFHEQLPPLFSMFKRISYTHSLTTSSLSTRQNDSFITPAHKTARTENTIKITCSQL